MSNRSRWILTCLTASLVLALEVFAQTQAPDRPRRAPGTDDPSEINKPFQSPDVAEWVKRFQSESREVYNARNAIVGALGLKPGMAIADVGAGTGLFTRLFAERVGPEGTVYAVDISPDFLRYIADEARKAGTPQIRTVRGTQESTNLLPASVDVAFLSDTYHHIEHPGPVLASIHRALRPAGRLYVVDFDRRPGVSTDFVLKHIRASKAEFLREIGEAGFEEIATPHAPRLSENFFAAFLKVERPGSRP